MKGGPELQDPPFLLYRFPPRMSTLIAAVRSFAAYLAVSLYVAIAAPVGMALALTFRWKSLLYVLGHWGVAIGTSLAGIRTRVAGREHVPPGQAVVFCCNHQSNIDPPILFQALHPRLHVLFKRELTRLPLLGKAFQIGGFVPIDRGSREQSMAAIDQAAASLRAGNTFLTFPEGTRSRTGALLPFKRGPFLMALKAQVPVVPVAIQGGTASMRKGSPIVRPTTVSVRIGKPVETRGMDISDREQLADEVRVASRRAARARAGYLRPSVFRLAEHRDGLAQSLFPGFLALGQGNPADIRPPVRRGQRLERLPRARVLLQRFLNVASSLGARQALGDGPSTMGRPFGLAFDARREQACRRPSAPHSV